MFTISAPTNDYMYSNTFFYTCTYIQQRTIYTEPSQTKTEPTASQRQRLQLHTHDSFFVRDKTGGTTALVQEPKISRVPGKGLSYIPSAQSKTKPRYPTPLHGIPVVLVHIYLREVPIGLHRCFFFFTPNLNGKTNHAIVKQGVSLSGSGSFAVGIP